MTRQDHCKRLLRGALAVLLIAVNAAGARAADPAPQSAEPPAAVERKAPAEAPLTPPPGISVIPSPQWRGPPAGQQVPGCSVREMKPLELLV